MDNPVLWYEGSAVSADNRKALLANWQGSITAISNADGSDVHINAYDAYGIANETNIGRFQYTGQIAIPELGLYHYKARVYSPTLGRFLQTDPIGYEDQVNLYAYVGNDPVNFIDPTGLSCEDTGGTASQGETNDEGGIIPGTFCDPGNPEADGPEIGVTGSGPRTGPTIKENREIIKHQKEQKKAIDQWRRNNCYLLVMCKVEPDSPKPSPVEDYCGSSTSSTEFVSEGTWPAACKAHDSCYGPQSNASRKTCDNYFRSDVYRLCKAEGGTSSSCRASANRYYSGVRLGGGLAYEGKGDSN